MNTCSIKNNNASAIEALKEKYKGSGLLKDDNPLVFDHLNEPSETNNLPEGSAKEKVQSGIQVTTQASRSTVLPSGEIETTVLPETQAIEDGDSITVIDEGELSEEKKTAGMDGIVLVGVASVIAAMFFANS